MQEAACALDQALAHELPIGEILNHPFDEGRAFLLVIEVVRVYPDIAGPQGVALLVSGLSASWVVTISSVPLLLTSQAQPLPN